MRKPTVPHTRAISANVPNAAHSIGSEPLNVVEPLTVAIMPRMRIIEAQRNRISSLSDFSGSRKRIVYAPAGIRRKTNAAIAHATSEKLTPVKAYTA